MNRRQETVTNKALLTFDVQGKCHTLESNEVKATIIDISVKKTQSCNIVFAGDKICYAIKICNHSCLDIDDLDFVDRLDTDVKYERNSFKVNGECKTAQLNGRTVCYHINKLKAYEEMVITFEVEVE